jgi:hypothetical protein
MKAALELAWRPGTWIEIAGKLPDPCHLQDDDVPRLSYMTKLF